jgi:acyl carrier protein
MIINQTYEADVRRVVAEQLGVGVEQIAPDVSLPDDLAADSLDLVELALALEARCGVAISDRRLETVRTYGDLLDVIATAPVSTPPVARFRIVCDGAARADHAGPLDPYTVDILVEEVRRAGPHAHVELEAEREDGIVAAARRRLAARGVVVSVRRAPSSLRAWTPSPSRAAREIPR